MSPHKRKLKHQQQRERGLARATNRKAAAASAAELARQDIRGLLAPRSGSGFLLAAGLEDAIAKK